MRKRIIIAISAVLGAAFLLFLMYLMMRDDGPPVVVQCNFSAKDVAEIKSAAKRKLWHDAFPDFSWRTIKALPRTVRHAARTHVRYINEYPQSTNYPKSNAWVLLSEAEDPQNSLLPSLWLTNGPAGWTCCAAPMTTGWTLGSVKPATNGP